MTSFRLHFEIDLRNQVNDHQLVYSSYKIVQKWGIFLQTNDEIEHKTLGYQNKTFFIVNLVIEMFKERFSTF